jgi:hypothetical protein
MTKLVTANLESAQTARGKEFLAKHLKLDTRDGAQFVPHSGDGKFDLEEAAGALIGGLQQMEPEDRNALLQRIAEHAHKHKWGTKTEERANKPLPGSKEFVFASKDRRIFGKALPSTEQVARDNAAFWEKMTKK